MTEYSEMGHEELAHAADPLNRIVNRDVAILGYTPSDDEVAAAQAELDQLNQAARERNAHDPWHPGAIGPVDAQGLSEDEVYAAVERLLGKR